MDEERRGIAFRDVLTVSMKVLGFLWLAFLVIGVVVALLISSDGDPNGERCRAASKFCFTHTETMLLLGAIGLVGMAALTLAFGVGLGIIWAVMRLRNHHTADD